MSSAVNISSDQKDVWSLETDLALWGTIRGQPEFKGGEIYKIVSGQGVLQI